MSTPPPASSRPYSVHAFTEDNFNDALSNERLTAAQVGRRRMTRYLYGYLNDLGAKTIIVEYEYVDDKEWLGQKRRALVQALNRALAGKVRELGGPKRADASAPTVTLRADGTLEEGQIRVKACWEAARPGTTLVVIPPDDGGGADPATDPDVTHVYVGEGSPDGDPTQVLLPDTPLFHVEVRRGDTREALVPVSQPRVRIGRGARTIPVDLRLKDPNISRLHATLEVDMDGNYWLTSLGQNPVVVNSRGVSKNERVKVLPDSRIDICSYSLSIK